MHAHQQHPHLVYHEDRPYVPYPDVAMSALMSMDTGDHISRGLNVVIVDSLYRQACKGGIVFG